MTNFRASISVFLAKLILITLGSMSLCWELPAQPNYRLESFEFVGSTRMTKDQVATQLGITPDAEMTDAWISASRTKLMGSGLFKDIVFKLRKGSKPGLTKLVITVEDDDDVLSDWALGGEFGLSLKEPTPAFGEDSVFRGYKLGIISRNLFLASHRGAALGDIDARGNLVAGHLAYGLPRFLAESIQFDAALAVVEARERYFEAEAFGLKAQGLWTRRRGGVDVMYGVAWYSNTHRRYRLNEWPDIVAGPKIGIIRETRFLGFLPSTGYRLSLAAVPSFLKKEQSVFESEIAGTWAFWTHAAISASGKSITSGSKAITTRAEGKIEFPLTSVSRGLRSLFYLAVRNGQDRYKTLKLHGTESVIGYRYHSTGFIGDISFRVTGDRPWDNTPLEPVR
jgi:hypothetical protein